MILLSIKQILEVLIIKMEDVINIEAILRMCTDRSNQECEESFSRHIWITEVKTRLSVLILGTGPKPSIHMTLDLFVSIESLFYMCVLTAALPLSFSMQGPLGGVCI